MTKNNKTLQLDSKAQETLLAIMTSKTMTAAAEKLLISRTVLYERINKYNLREQIEKVPQQALENLKLASMQATDVLIDGLFDRHARYDNAKDILDRVGVGVNKVPSSLTQINVGGEMGVKITTYDPDTITQETETDIR